MNANNLSPLNALLNIVESTDDFHAYENHPEDVLIQNYVDGVIPSSGRSVDDIRENFSNDNVVEWGRVEVALHVKTCEQCWKKVSDIRMAQRTEVNVEVPESPVQVNQVSIISKIQAFIDNMIVPGPRLAFTSAFLVIVGIGIGIMSTSIIPSGDVASLPDPSPMQVGGGAPQIADIGAALRTLGVDVAAFDFSQNFYLHRVQEGDTLGSVAAQNLGGEQFWIVVLLINYQTLSGLDSAESVLPVGMNISLPFML